MALYAMIVSLITTVTLFICYTMTCKRVGRKLKFKGLIKELAENLHGADIMHSCYVAPTNQSAEPPLQVKVESMADMIEGLKPEDPYEDKKSE